MQPYIRSYIGFRLANPYLGCATKYEVPRWNQNMVAQPYIIPGQDNISRQNNMSSHIELCDVLGLRRMSCVLTSVAAFIHWIPTYNPYPLLLPDYEITERQSPYRLVWIKKIKFWRFEVCVAMAFFWCPPPWIPVRNTSRLCIPFCVPFFWLSSSRNSGELLPSSCKKKGIPFHISFFSRLHFQGFLFAGTMFLQRQVPFLLDGT